jgi:hypothetical protein
MGYSSSFFKQNTGLRADQALTTGMGCLREGRMASSEWRMGILSDYSLLAIRYSPY